MARRKKIYEGKAKILYEGPEPGTLVQYFKDDATAGNGAKKEVFEGKGVLNNRLSEFFMTRPQPDRRAHPLHPPPQHARAARPPGRDHPARGHRAQLRGRLMAKRLGLRRAAASPPHRGVLLQGRPPGRPAGARGVHHRLRLGPQQDLDDIVALALRVNDFLSGVMHGVGIKLVDFKIEVGRIWDDDFPRLVVADEISPDSCRLWDIETGRKLDKDVFRKDLGNLTDAYTEVARRLGVLPSNVTHRPSPRSSTEPDAPPPCRSAQNLSSSGKVLIWLRITALAVN